MSRTSTGSRRGRGRHEQGRDERGAIAIVVAICVLLLAGIASFAVDLGYQRVAARDMQAVADVVAMDMARELDGRTSAELVGPGWQNTVAESLGRNDDDAVGQALGVVSCAATTAELGVAAGAAAGEICAYPGILHADGSFTDSGAAPATHVRVLAATAVDYFLPVFAEGGAVGKQALAKASSQACLRLGSFAVNLDSQKSVLLDVLLGDALNTTTLGYAGLATSRVSLFDLAAELGAGSPHQILDAELSVSQLYLAMADVLVADGDTVNATLLQSIATQASASTTVQLSDVLSLDTTQGSVLDAELNVLDLVAGSAFVANGTNLLSIPAATVSIPGLSSVSASLKVIEAPRPACGRVGRARAETAQFELKLTGTVNNADLGIIGLLDLLNTAKATIDVSLSVTAAESTALLTDATCAAGTVADPLSITADVNNALARLDLVLDAKVHVLGITKVGIRTAVSDVAGANQSTATVTIDSEPADPGDWAVPTQTGSNSLGGVGASTSSHVYLGNTSLLSTLLPRLESNVYNQLNASLDTKLVTPLVQLFGLTLGGSDLFALRPAPTCNSPALAG